MTMQMDLVDIMLSEMFGSVQFSCSVVSESL